MQKEINMPKFQKLFLENLRVELENYSKPKIIAEQTEVKKLKRI